MRSKTLLTTNILASLYTFVMAWFFIGLQIVDGGGNSIINAVGGALEGLFGIIHMNLAITNYLYVIGILMLVHTGVFVVGMIFSWISYANKSNILATVAAVVFLIGTGCAPVLIVFGLPITALTFIGAINQGKINKKENGGNTDGK